MPPSALCNPYLFPKYSQLLSLNIFKIYQAVGRHIEKHPEERDLFPNYSAARKPFVLRGSEGPLSGELHNANYFHGRYAYIQPQ